jgi:hypothetical protein
MTPRQEDNALGEILGLLEEPDLSLGAARRGRIVREAVSVRKRTGLASAVPSRLPAVAWASALGMALFVLVSGQFWAPGTVQDSPQVSPPSAGPRLVMADYRDGQMILEWTDGGRQAFTVRRDTSLESAREAPGEVVRGHRFVDVAPSDSRVVFYVVE